MPISAKEKIQQAFVQLVLEKGFEKTSVSAIIKLASIHRSTFYAHYVDKYDLLEKLQDQVLLQMVQHVLTGEDCIRRTSGADNEQYLPLLHYIKENKDLISALQSGVLAQEFMLRFQNELDAFYLEYYRNHDMEMPVHPVIPEIYYDKIMTEAIFITIRFWMERDCQEDVKVIAATIAQLEKI